ncbi:MAG: oligosaccharide flippase family protein [Capnocytophaga sp.]|nr:oligosaccharide flippase family protein [Capnocytophaga sp.]
MSNLKRLFKHTFIYGIATVLPRFLSLFLTPLYVDLLPTSDYGIYSGLLAYLIMGNVLLSYGMETAFFRFMNKNADRKKVQSTALSSLFISSLVFFVVAWLLRENIARWIRYDEAFVSYSIAILTLDALVVIPFAWFRNEGKPVRYAVVKIGNVGVNLLLNLFLFLLLPKLAENGNFWNNLIFENKVHYIFIANLTASLLTFLVLLPIYFKIRLGLSRLLLSQMLRYAYPVLIAGIAFSINEGFDRIFLRMLLPADTADTTIGIYAACYKMGVFMTLFVTAYKLGVEPFFFSNAKEKDAPQTYASVTLYFTIFGSFVLLFVTVFTDWLKYLLIPNSDYWEALWIVPIILLANLCLGIYHSLSVWYKVTDRTNYGAIISVVGAVITIIANFTLIPLWSYKGAALATLAAYSSMLLISYCIGQKKYPIPYSLQKIGLYFGYSVIASLLVFYVFNRTLLIGVFFLVGYLLMVFFLEKRTFRLKKT